MKVINKYTSRATPEDGTYAVMYTYTTYVATYYVEIVKIEFKNGVGIY